MEYSDSFKEQVEKVIQKSLKEQHLQLLIVDYELKRRKGEDYEQVYRAICELCQDIYGFVNSEPLANGQRKYF